jgi:hypothetical protein
LTGSSYATFRLAFLVSIAVYAVTESVFNRLSPIWFTFLLVVMEYSSRDPSPPLNTFPVEQEKQKSEATSEFALSILGRLSRFGIERPSRFKDASGLNLCDCLPMKMDAFSRPLERGVLPRRLSVCP